MNSESLYHYSKARQHQPGFVLIEGRRPEILYEHSHADSPESMFSLLCTLQSIGRYRCAAPAFLYRNLVFSFDMLYVYEGDLEIQALDNSRLQLNAQEAFLTGSMNPYRLRCGGNKPADFLLLSHCGAIAEKYYGLICKSGARKIRIQEKEIFEDLLEELGFYIRYPFRMNQPLSANVLTQILTHAYLGTLDPEEYTIRGQPKWLLHAMEYMDKYYAGKITVADIADYCGLSASHFNKLFRENTGMPPYQYLKRLRITIAKMHLKNGDMPIKSIAYTAGFRSASHFIVHFREETGITPDNYRRIYRSQNP